MESVAVAVIAGIFSLIGIWYTNYLNKKKDSQTPIQGEKMEFDLSWIKSLLFVITFFISFNVGIASNEEDTSENFVKFCLGVNFILVYILVLWYITDLEVDPKSKIYAEFERYKFHWAGWLLHGIISLFLSFSYCFLLSLPLLFFSSNILESGIGIFWVVFTILINCILLLFNTHEMRRFLILTKDITIVILLIFISSYYISLFMILLSGKAGRFIPSIYLFSILIFNPYLSSKGHPIAILLNKALILVLGDYVKAVRDFFFETIPNVFK